MLHKHKQVSIKIKLLKYKLTNIIKIIKMKIQIKWKKIRFMEFKIIIIKVIMDYKNQETKRIKVLWILNRFFNKMKVLILQVNYPF